MTNRVVTAPTYVDTKSEQFRYVFVTGVFGGVNPADAQMIFYLERLEPETIDTPRPGFRRLKRIVREAQVEVHMTPTQFKSIADWMSKNIAEYEKNIGPLAPPPKKGKKKPSGTDMYA